MTWTLPATTFAVVALLAVACNRTPAGEERQPAMADSGIRTLEKKDTKLGTGTEARKGQTVRVHYTGWLYDANVPDRKGRQFDNSRDGNSPFEFRLGAAEVIPGWEEGIAGMKVGGIRVLTIPPSMAYGSSGASGVIPPNATLVFDIELRDVR